MKLKQFVAELELYLNMFKTVERCYLTTYYYDTKRVTWFTKIQFNRHRIADDWEIEKKN
jgi:hypothetical protein